MKPTQYTHAPRIIRRDTPLGKERYLVRWTEPGRVTRRRSVRSIAEAEALVRAAPRLTGRTVTAVLTNRITIDPASGCWNVSGSMKSNGYPRMEVEGVKRNTHRVMFELWYGQIPEELTLDHICRNHRCCNPEHLEPVTGGENALRGESPVAVSVRENRCQSGHEFTAENTYVKPKSGYRECRICMAEKRRQRWANRRS